MCILSMKDYQLGSDMCWGWEVLYILVSCFDHQGSQIWKFLGTFETNALISLLLKDKT